MFDKDVCNWCVANVSAAQIDVFIQIRGYRIHTVTTVLFKRAEMDFSCFISNIIHWKNWIEYWNSNIVVLFFLTSRSVTLKWGFRSPGTVWDGLKKISSYTSQLFDLTSIKTKTILATLICQMTTRAIAQSNTLYWYNQNQKSQHEETQKLVEGQELLIWF